MANQWFKFYGTEYLSDQKIERLNPVERSCWLTLLCLASANETGEIKHLTVQVLLNKSGIQYDPYRPELWEEALGIFEKLEMLEMIQRVDVGTILIKNWDKRQESYLSDAERAKNYRDRKKERHENVTAHVTNVTLEENRIEENRIEDIDTEVAVAPIPSPKKFQKPKIEEVKAYCDERSNGIDPQAFIDYYESNGWKVGKNSMKDWKASVRTWERNGYSKNKTSTTTTTNLDDPNAIAELNKKYK